MPNVTLSEVELLARLPEPAAWRHNQTLVLSETQEDVSLADGDEFAEPLYTLEQIYKFRIQDILEELKKVQNAD